MVSSFWKDTSCASAFLGALILVINLHASYPFMRHSQPPPMMRRSQQTTTTTRYSTTTTSSIQWCESNVEITDICQIYPDTMWRRLTSSVPRREFALQNISCMFYALPLLLRNSTVDNNNVLSDPPVSVPRSLVLLIGASSSGKSALLKVIQGQERPNRGTVQFSTTIPTGSSSDTSTTTIVAKPIMLDDRSPLSRQNEAVHSELRTVIRNVVAEYSTVGMDSTDWISFEDAILGEMLSCLGLSPEKKLSSLTPSEDYRFRLAKASLESTLHYVDSRMFCIGGRCLQLPGPILLLDEWLDKETGQVASKVIPALQNIVHNFGGIVLSATHKPALYEQTAPLSKIMLSSGKILNQDLPN
ncbi:ABC transporter-like protein [Nitzschia inconspicua]|uniref:ABC transporter-like protein n=1 Tax=Nitzschia inconspicua TaxID=303405 RepID=A0A9K3KFN7_9STRA|nr:ABC transporter-like protein [Nitzschia inconspicua]